MEPDQRLFENLCDLRDLQAPIFEGGLRNPKRKTAYFRALAEAFEAGKLLPVKGSLFDAD